MAAWLGPRMAPPRDGASWFDLADSVRISVCQFLTFSFNVKYCVIRPFWFSLGGRESVLLWPPWAFLEIPSLLPGSAAPRAALLPGPEPGPGDTFTWAGCDVEPFKSKSYIVNF